LPARELDVDDAVHLSEAATGNRNRAIAWLLRKLSGVQATSIGTGHVFPACAILVTARDLAVMAAYTGQSRISNPVTGVKVITPMLSPARFR